VTCYFSLISPATHAALALRRSMPDAWFSSSVTWYALGAVLLASAAIAVVVSRKVYKLESMDIRATSNPSDVEGHSSSSQVKLGALAHLRFGDYTSTRRKEWSGCGAELFVVISADSLPRCRQSERQACIYQSPSPTAFAPFFALQSTSWQ